MIGLVVLLFGAQTAAAPPAMPAPDPRGIALPVWTDRLQAKDWPFLSMDASRTVVLFAKAAPGRAGEPEEVWMRQEYKEAQTDPAVPAGVVAQPYKSERIVAHVDCARRVARRFRVYRYPENNLEGRPEVYGYEGVEWAAPDPESFDAAVLQAACLRS
ncbi:surface-adhesin E family protein [Phenylobacterium deserti]|uniref:Surface-adhesin protein E-like domain-containing protein n=1 Tax=Phenylobacterium deserti TaxID=1914756 RepID=A0A328ABZ1_9CAUL|nr:surface-adhesin E family protein [Phenylobacterium deserti]RAK51997.1 hypothetical protein DJ018_12590 [Phenylobacterium deserti]